MGLRKRAQQRAQMLSAMKATAWAWWPQRQKFAVAEKIVLVAEVVLDLVGKRYHAVVHSTRLLKPRPLAAGRGHEAAGAAR